LKVGSLFTGIGGFDLGFERAGMEIAWQVEIDEFCNKVLAKHWPNVKRFKDVKTVSGKELEPVDLLCGGVPCQPASCAGKRRGTKDDRWLWKEPFRIIAELDPKPKWCVFENVRGLLTLENGLVFDNLLSELENLGYETRTFCLPACAVNAPHRRDRVWIVAHSERKGSHGSEAQTYGRGEYIWQRDEMGNGLESSIDCYAPDTSNQRLQGSEETGNTSINGEESRNELIGRYLGWQEPWLEVAQRFCQLDDGLPDRLARPARNRNRVQKLKALGNAVVPQIPEILGRAIMGIDHET
jgi:DNA (cytosine-5)-methyltransferase 1